MSVWNIDAPEPALEGAPGVGAEGAEKKGPSCRVVDEIRLPPHKYNTIRSFVESSTSPEYDFNRPYCYHDIIFFIKPGKWKLEYRETERQRQAGVDKYEETNKRLILYELGGLDNMYVYILHYDPVYNVLCFGDKCYDDHSACVVLPTKKLPFSRPIPCYEIVAKMKFYYNMVPR